jgi:hypothetical protein
VIRDDGYYNVHIDGSRRISYALDFNGVFYMAIRTSYARNARGSWEIDAATGGSRKLWETRDHAEAKRKWESLIASEPRAVHSSRLGSGGAL